MSTHQYISIQFCIRAKHICIFYYHELFCITRIGEIIILSLSALYRTLLLCFIFYTCRCNVNRYDKSHIKYNCFYIDAERRLFHIKYSMHGSKAFCIYPRRMYLIQYQISVIYCPSLNMKKNRGLRIES